MIPALQPLTGGWRIALTIGLVMAALMLVSVGRWGYRNADALVPTSYSEQGQRRRARALRHGAIMCQFAAGVLVTAAVMLTVGAVG